MERNRAHLPKPRRKLKMKLDTVDKRLLNLLQTDFPLSGEPFAVLGSMLDISGDEVLQRLANLKGGGIIRWISGVFDSSKLGYQSTLVAMRVSDRLLDEAASAISEHQGVSHNYARDHYYNLWFTLTLPKDKSLPKTINNLAELAGAEATMSLPAVRVFKRLVYFDMVGTGKPESNLDYTGESNSLLIKKENKRLSKLDREAIKELQMDLPLGQRPFDELAGHLGIGTDELLSVAESLQARGIMRRYGASLNHQKAGFLGNAMSCWSVPLDMLEQAGNKMASCQAVSHCYQRQTNANWPYNLFAMIHSHSKDECEAIAKQISNDTKASNYVLLYTAKEYKKEKVRYFTELN